MFLIYQLRVVLLNTIILTAGTSPKTEQHDDIMLLYLSPLLYIWIRSKIPYFCTVTFCCFASALAGTSLVQKCWVETTVNEQLSEDKETRLKSTLVTELLHYSVLSSSVFN